MAGKRMDRSRSSRSKSSSKSFSKRRREMIGGLFLEVFALVAVCWFFQPDWFALDDVIPSPSAASFPTSGQDFAGGNHSAAGVDPTGGLVSAGGLDRAGGVDRAGEAGIQEIAEFEFDWNARAARFTDDELSSASLLAQQKYSETQWRSR